MSYGTPTDPVGGTVITVAYAVANLLDPIRWLRLLIGNADPPGSSYVVVSSSTTGTAWSRIPTDAIADRAVTTIKIGIGSVTSNEIADLTIIAQKIANATITEAKMVPGTITGNTGSSAIGTGVIHPNRMTNAGISGAIPVNDGATTNWGKVNYPSLDATNTPTHGQIIVWNNSAGKMEWQTTSAVAGVPSGLIAAFATAAAIASGWARYTAADGRMLVGAGTTFSVTYTESTDYGSSWGHTHGMSSHTHTGPSHTHSGSDLSIAGSTGASVGSSTRADGANPVASDGHTHGVGSLDVAGNTAADGTGATGGPSVSDTASTSWVIPSRAVVWAIKS